MKINLQVSSNDREEASKIFQLPLSQGQPPLLLIAGVYIIAWRRASPLYLHPQDSISRPLVGQMF